MKHNFRQNGIDCTTSIDVTYEKFLNICEEISKNIKETLKNYQAYKNMIYEAEMDEKAHKARLREIRKIPLDKLSCADKNEKSYHVAKLASIKKNRKDYTEMVSILKYYKKQLCMIKHCYANIIKDACDKLGEEFINGDISLSLILTKYNNPKSKKNSYNDSRLADAHKVIWVTARPFKIDENNSKIYL